MEANEYQKLAMRTADPQQSRERRLLNAALGLCSEAGEFADAIKKHEFHAHALDLPELEKELGDVLWYVAQACEALGLELSTVMETNIAKLRQRYPEGFSSERSINRT